MRAARRKSVGWVMSKSDERNCEDRDGMRSIWNITTIPTGKREKVDAPLLNGGVVEHAT